ncbi:putative xanthine dehydrogenase subunit A [Austwickia sp. TVS 96-490-7B]|nr:putative xanthine dehydrogenase subunit A [Austwickia sp. TVS 96-490-7B]
MKDIISDLRQWCTEGTEFALATVVETWQSAPRPLGAALALSTDGDVIGSVSGGCVEGAVIDVARDVLSDGQPRRVRYGVANESAFTVGLTCGGTIELFVTRVDDNLRSLITALTDAIDHGHAAAVATLITGPHQGARLLITDPTTSGPPADTGLTGELEHAVRAATQGQLAAGRSAQIQLGGEGPHCLTDVTVFVEAYVPPPRMIIFGAIDFAAALARLGSFLGYHVTVCDARAVFATPQRFPDADEVVVAWPHVHLDQVTLDERTVLCVLTHDPKFDIPLLVKALRRPARYIGAMGSRRTHADRLAALRREGLTDNELARLRSPIGLDLGGRTPEETAISIAAEIIACTGGGSGLPLSATDNPIHRC